MKEKEKENFSSPHQPRKRQLPDQQLGRALVLADLAQGDGARAVPPLGCFIFEGRVEREEREIVEVEVEKKWRLSSKKSARMERKKNRENTRMRLSNDSLHSRPFPRFSAPSSSRRRRDPLGRGGGGGGEGEASGDEEGENGELKKKKESEQLTL